MIRAGRGVLFLILCIFHLGKVTDTVSFGIQNPFESQKSVFFECIFKRNFTNKENYIFIGLKFINLSRSQSGLNLTNKYFVRTWTNDRRSCGSYFCKVSSPLSH